MPDTPPPPADLDRELTDLRTTLAQAREALDHAERRHAVEIELLKADAVDLETARLMAELALTDKPITDVPSAVAELKSRKPFLFRRKPATSASNAAMVPALVTSAPAAQAADEARRTGDRNALLRYLKARRAT